MVDLVEGTLDEAKDQLEELGVRPTIIRATLDGLEEPDVFTAETEDSEVAVKIKDPKVQRVLGFLFGVLRRLKVEGKVEIEITEDQVDVRVLGPELGFLIGHHGETLNAIQFFVNIVAGREGFFEDRRLCLDVENYRERRQLQLEDLALRMAERVAATGEDIVLRPLPASERRIIHKYLQDDSRVDTISEGEEPNRSTVIMAKTEPTEAPALDVESDDLP